MKFGDIKSNVLHRLEKTGWSNAGDIVNNKLNKALMSGSQTKLTRRHTR